MVQDYVDGNEHCKYLFNTLSLSKACKRLLRLRLDVTRKDHLVLCLLARRRNGRRRTASSIAQGAHNSFTVARHIIRSYVFKLQTMWCHIRLSPRTQTADKFLLENCVFEAQKTVVRFFFWGFEYEICLFQVLNVRKRKKKNPCHMHFN